MVKTPLSGVKAMINSLAFRTIIIGIILTALVAGGAFYLFQPKNTTSTPQESKNLLESSVPSKTFKEYVDESGFSFRYPDDVVINKKDIKDETIYADLELNSPKAKGNITIKIMDTKIKSLEDWFLENKLSSLSASVKNSRIGDLPGWEIKFDSQLTTISLDQNILFTIDVNPQGEYWVSVRNTLLSSFIFVEKQQESSLDTQSTDPAESDIILEEEVIE